MKKMLYITFARIPTEKAHGSQIMHMCEAFAKLGMDVELILPKRSNTLKMEDAFAFYGVEKLFRVMHVPIIDMLGLGRFGYYLTVASFVLSAKWYVWRQRIQGIVYTRDALLSLLFPGCVVELHDAPKVSSRVWSWLLRRASACIVKTTHLKSVVTSNGIHERAVMVVGNGVDVAAFDKVGDSLVIRRQLGLPLDKKIVLYIGSFFTHAWKGVDVLLEAIAYLPPDTHAVLVGGSLDDVVRIKKQYGVERLTVRAAVPQKDVAAWIKTADVLVLPNKSGYTASDLYTSPLKLFEYMVSGIPIVASDLPSVREIATSEEVLFVEPNNPQALAEGIVRVLHDPHLASLIRKNAYSRGIEYTWEKQAGKILTFIDRDEAAVRS